MLERSKTYTVKKSAKLEYVDVMDFDDVHRLYAVWQVSGQQVAIEVRAPPPLLRPPIPAESGAIP